jgi:high affinity sulfate transporter 1
VPALEWLRHYRRAWLRGDVVAALTTWALVVPQAIAYAQIAGLPPQTGLFAAFAGLLGYGLFGTCRQLIVSPTSSTAAISAAIVAPVALGDPERFAAASAALAMLVGVVLIGLGQLRMGFVSRFISAGVQVGFMFGLGLTIIVGQLPKLLGVPAGDGNFFGQAGVLLGHLGDTNPWTAAIGVGSLAVLLGARRARPSLPAALVVVVAGIAVVALGDLDSHGVEVIGAVKGAVPLPRVPSVGWDELVGLLGGAVAVAIIGYAESATVAESMAEEHGYHVTPDRELRAIGIANILSGLFQGFITGGGASQSAANDRAGAQTQLVSLLVSALTVVTAIALLPLFRDLPQATLGAVVISAVLGFINLPALARIRRLRRDSFVIALVALAAVLVLGVLKGLIVGVVISAGMLLVRTSRPGASVRAEPGLLVYRLDAPLLYVNAKRLRDAVQAQVGDAATPVRAVVLDLSFSSELDIESVNVLASLRHELDRRGVALWLAGVHAGELEMLGRSGLADSIGRSRLSRGVEDAVRDARAALGGGDRSA